MKLIDVVECCQYAIIRSAYDCYELDVSRDDDDYKSIKFERTISLACLISERDYIFDVIRYADGEDANNIEKVDVYSAVLDSGEEVDIYVPEFW